MHTYPSKAGMAGYKRGWHLGPTLTPTGNKMRRRNKIVIGGSLLIILPIFVMYNLNYDRFLNTPLSKRIEVYGAAAISIGVLMAMSACSRYFRLLEFEILSRSYNRFWKAAKINANNDNMASVCFDRRLDVEKKITEFL
jgi:hypothetical protein